jgi:hypothetical protein
MPIQLIAVRSGMATVQRDDMAPVEMTWGLLHEAQQQVGPAGYVYRWLMHEYCRCEYEQRSGRPWISPAREIEDIVQSLQAADAQQVAEMAARRREANRQADLEQQRRAIEDERRRVEAERARTATDDPWWPITAAELPLRLRFDTPRRNQGQIVEVSYGTFGRAEADSCDPYMLVTDHSDGTTSFYRRRDHVS